MVAQQLPQVTAFAFDLDTWDLFLPMGSTPLDVDARPDVKAVVDRFNDDIVDAIARLMYLGKGDALPPDPLAGDAVIQLEDWRAGELVPWFDAMPFLRGDPYRLGERLYEASELYCEAAGASANAWE